jgi:hypothetical protein
MRADNHAIAVARRMHRQLLMSISYGDRSVATLRTLVTAIERQFTVVPPPEELRAAWAEMVDVLALGPPPELRTCPTCGEIGMRAATRCIRCWSSLPLLPPENARLQLIQPAPVVEGSPIPDR